MKDIFSPKFDIKISQAKDGWKTSLFESKLKDLNHKKKAKLTFYDLEPLVKILFG